MFWQPIETAPKDGTIILLRGDSGYTNTPYRVAVGYWREFINREGGYWADHAGDWFVDDGPEATHWAPLPPV